MAIQKIVVPDAENDRILEKLAVDGKLDIQSDIQEGDWEIKSSKTFFGLLTYASEAYLFNGCHSILYYRHQEAWCEYPINVLIRFKEDTPGEARMLLYLTFDLYKWDKSYSFNALKSCFERTCEQLPDITYDEDSEYEDGASIDIACLIKDPKAPLRHTFDHLIYSLQQLVFAERNLFHETTPSEPESLTATFNFPPEIRSACNQYLLYFGQFLEDLGILADTSLKEHVNKVLFTVTPRDKDQALDVIYEALNVFLHAPDSEITDDMNDQDFAHYQWKMNIYHLKGQLELAKAVLLAKDATIDALKDALQIANYQVGQAQPAPALPASDKEDEDILGGVISITKIKGKGFTINLPRIIRKLRRKK